ncbi:MAG: hydrogenase nickel incorporation protein HypA [Acidimicrobiia bacterium]|nr:hydrogenase nickel incorporation protein HypA [Acidimicrobiia bacterium]MDX2465685.1 hydrogenase nickel incorporation protein HypA [Acidimicrobiia bacterium]
MHELALADSVVKAALSAADGAGMNRIERIVVKVGELQQIERDLFEFSLTTVLPAQDKRLADVVFDVSDEPVRFGCRACGTEYGRDDVNIDGDGDQGEAIHFIPELSHAFARCPSCGSPDFEILAGRGITLQRIEGSGEDDPG